MTSLSFTKRLCSPPVLVASLLLAGGLLFIGQCATADDWPTERGNPQNTGVATSSLGDSLDLMWSSTLVEGGFEAAAAVVDGVIYIGDNEGTFHAIRLADGHTVWAKSFPDCGFISAPAVHSDRIVVADYDGLLRALNRSDGSLLWSVALDAEVYGGPMPHGDSLLVTSEAGALVCLNLADGSERWKYATDAPLRCSPTVVSNVILLAGCGRSAHIVSADTGEKLAELDIDSETGSTPAAVDGIAYIGTVAGAFHAIDLTDTSHPSIRWTFSDTNRQQIRVSAAVDERITVFNVQGKTVFALDRKTGDLKWKYTTRSRVDSSPVIAGQRVVIATSRGRIFLLDADSGAQVWQFEAGGSFLASPAVVDGRLILGNTDGTLYCFGSGAR